MKSTYTTNALRGQAIGAGFFTGFGAIWLGLSLYIREQWTPVNVSLLTTGLVALAIGCLMLFSESRQWPGEPEDPEASRTFHRVNTAQWIAIFAVSTIFGRWHLDAYVFSVITAIVGVHLFPLAKIFRRPRHLVTGLAMVLWASITVLFVPIEHMQGITALGTGTILWTSASLTVVTGLIAARRPSGSRPPRSSLAA